MTDKLNHVDYHWYLVRTQPGHERELGCLIDREKENTHNILEAYCPTHTTVNVRHGDQERKLPSSTAMSSCWPRKVRCGSFFMTATPTPSCATNANGRKTRRPSRSPSRKNRCGRSWTSMTTTPTRWWYWSGPIPITLSTPTRTTNPMRLSAYSTVPWRDGKATSAASAAKGTGVPGARHRARKPPHRLLLQRL